MTKDQFRPNLAALRAECDLQAMPLAWGNRSYGDCCDAVMGVAVHLGATQLSTAALYDLERWVGDTVMAAVAKHQPAADAHIAMLDRVFSDNDAWMAEWMARQGQPGRLAA